MSRPSRTLTAVAVAALLPALAVLGAPTHADAAPDRSVSAAASPARPVAYTVSGRVVRFSNGRPVRGVRVGIWEGDFDSTPYGADLTDADGRFTVSFTAEDDGFGVYVNGSRVGVQSGWVGCDLTPKRSFGAACVHGEKVGAIRVKAT